MQHRIKGLVWFHSSTDGGGRSVLPASGYSPLMWTSDDGGGYSSIVLQFDEEPQFGAWTRATVEFRERTSLETIFEVQRSGRKALFEGPRLVAEMQFEQPLAAYKENE